MAGLVKRYGNGTPGIIFNNSLDKSELENTCEGVTSGPYTGEGTSMPPSRIWNDGRPYFPVQTEFWGVSTEIKPLGSDFSMRHRTLAEFPMTYNNINTGFTNRSEFSTENDVVLRSKQAFRISVYIPTETTISASGGTSPRRHMIFQSHTSGSPGFAIYIDRYGFIMISLNKGSDGASGYTYIPVKPITKNSWMHFIIFMEYDGSFNGRCVIWDDRVLARTYRPSGTTYVPNTVQTGSSGAYILNNSIQGRFPEIKNVGGNNVNLFNWYGFTLPINSPGSSDDPENVTQKWGWYCHEWNSFYRTVADAQDRFESGDFDGETQRETAANCILKNPDNPSGDFYIHPDDREKILYTVTRFTHWDETDTDEDVFRRLHPEGLSPLEVPLQHSVDGTPVIVGGVHLEDFTWSESEGLTYDLNVTAQTGGTVSATRDSESINFPIILEEDDEVVLTAIPNNENWEFAGWFEGPNSEPISTNNPYTFTMPDRNVTLEARFTFIGQGQGKKFFAKKKNQPIT